MALVRAPGGGPAVEVTPAGADVRSRVYEYGGGAWCLVPDPGGAGPRLAAVERSDQRVWLHRPPAEGQAPPGEPVPLTPSPPPGERWSHGDLCATADGSAVLAVRERVWPGGVERALVACDVGRPESAEVLLTTSGFLAAPRPDPASELLAFVRWHHPDMRWDASTMQVARLCRGGSGAPTLADERTVAGGAGPSGAGASDAGVSVGPPAWCGRRRLVFACDAGGWWQPWSWTPEGGAGRRCGLDVDFHAPDWALGQSLMAWLGGERLGCRWTEGGRDHLGVLDLATGAIERLEQPCVTVSAVCSHDGNLAWLGRTHDSGTAAWWSEATPSPGPARLLGAVRRPAGATAPGSSAGVGAGVATWSRLVPSPLRPEDVSVGRPFSFEGRPVGGRGAQGAADSPVEGASVEGRSVAGVEDARRRTVHGLLYLPRLGDVQGPGGTRPPLIVQCHGGPTGSAEAGLDVVVQFFTTRGYAVAAVDYAGSSGHGRAFREALRGQWGVADVDDCVDAAGELVRRGLVDRARLAVRGSSAGGFTALNALVRSDVFAAAASWYGVTDLLALSATTHDFESHYNDWLVGELPAAEATYRRRSPRYRVDDLHGAVLLLQGLEDPVVPAEQAEAMAAALRQRGMRCEHRVFAGESHGFRSAGTVAACLEAEHAFYLEVMDGPAAAAPGMLQTRPPG